MPNDSKEHEFVHRIQQGDAAAEDELVNRISGRIEEVVRRKLIHAQDDWKDVVSEILIAVIEKLREGNFKAEKGSLGQYIYGITLHKMNDYLKKEYNKKDPLDALENEDNATTADEKIINDELSAIMLKLIKKLPFKFREVILLRYYKELSVKEIANRLNIEPKTISTRLNYAHKLLKKYMDGQEFFQ